MRSVALLSVAGVQGDPVERIYSVPAETLSDIH
jgi:hypothetical protein